MLPRFQNSLAGTARAVKRGRKAARLTCANTAARVTCRVTYPGAKRKKRVNATHKLAGTMVAKGSVRKANAKGRVTMTGAKSLLAGVYHLSVKVGRTTHKFKVTLA